MAFKADMEQVEFLNIDYWFYAYGGIKSFEGMGHLGRMSDMAFCFASCSAVMEDRPARVLAGEPGGPDVRVLGV